jgi:hypothetical protein
MERDVELGCERLGEGEIDIGFFAAQAVMKMSRVQHQAQFPTRLTILVDESAQKGDGIRTAGETDGETKAGTQESCVERKRGAHERMITATVNCPFIRYSIDGSCASNRDADCLYYASCSLIDVRLLPMLD